MKICSNCGSKNIDPISPIDWSTWVCESCAHIGPALEGNEELIKKIRENYTEKLKENEEINEIEEEKRAFLKDTIKVCPNCGSDNIDWVLPQLWSIWQCKTCGFRGLAIEGNEELIRNLRENYIKKLKESDEINETEQENEAFEDELSDEEIDKKLDEILNIYFDSYIPQNEAVTTEKEEKLISGVNSNIVEIYKDLKKEILSWNKEIIFKAKDDYLTFSKNSRFLKLCFEENRINLQLSFNETKSFDDYKDITEEIIVENEIDRMITLNFSLNSYDEMEYALFLIKQSYENNKNDFLENILANIFPQSKHY